MKFFFCEGCGKRLTELEIDAGEGRDKKLKGVYCSECSVGVTTMETLPLTQGQAEKMLKEISPQDSPIIYSTQQGKKISRIVAAKSKREEGLRSSHSRAPHEAPVSGYPRVKFIAIVVMSGLVAIGALKLLSTPMGGPQAQGIPSQTEGGQAKPIAQSSSEPGKLTQNVRTDSNQFFANTHSDAANRNSKKTLPKERTLDLGSGVIMKFILIKAGTFTMGDLPIEKKSNFSQSQVTLTRDFYLGKYEVTEEQYTTVMGGAAFSKNTKNIPVTHVTWNDGESFCMKLSELSGNRVRLPTSAEWEYTCRAGTPTHFSFGESESELNTYGWSTENSGAQKRPVGQKEPNPWGLYDMHGNVWEWCQDWYTEETPSAMTDPKGPPSGEARVIRGGSYHNEPRECRSARRAKALPDHVLRDRGFRVALDP